MTALLIRRDAVVDEKLVDDRYRLVERVGDGTTAEVWRAVDVRLQRTVALKLFRPGVTDPLRERVELESMVRLTHPGLVSVYDAGSCAGPGGVRTYLVLEFVAGGTLRDRSAGPVLPTGRAALIGGGLARTLHHLHAAGTSHGNVTTGNILLCGDVGDAGGAPAAKLADFGVARMLAAAPVDASADVYALGQVLFELDPELRTDPMLAAMTDPDPSRRPGALHVAHRLDQHITRPKNRPRRGRHRVGDHA